MALYKDVTLLITHYNRPHSLERLLLSLKNAGLGFGAIVVSDDASDGAHFSTLLALQKVYPFVIVPGTVNQGLGHNLNKGQRQVTTPYVLYIQEDFEFTPLFVAALPEATALLSKDAGLDLVRFFAHFRYPYLVPYSTDFEEVSIPFLSTNYNKIYSYSDTPHLRRADFERKFGPYREGINADRTEYYMCISFIKNKGRCVISKQYAGLFTHQNLAEEPSTIHRPGRQFKNGFLIRTARYCYRQLRYNFDLLLAGKHRS